MEKNQTRKHDFQNDFLQRYPVGQIHGENVAHSTCTGVSMLIYNRTTIKPQSEFINFDSLPITLE